MQQKINESFNAPSTDFTGGHYDEPNVLAHVRFNERTDANGKRTLFIEEIQSDWNIEGRKKGYRANEQELKALQVQHEEVARRTRGMYAHKGEPGYDEYQASLDRLDAAKNGIPSTPFKQGAWQELTLKRMIRWAAENGFDQIAWTPGEVQQDRYDLSKQADQVLLDEVPNAPGQFNLIARKDGANVLVQQRIKQDDIKDYVGKGVAEKLLAAPRNGYGMRSLEGVELKIGGEWAINLYDKQMVDIANKLGKKFGSKVGTTRVGVGPPTVAKEARGLKTVHSLPITPEMKASVMQGQAVMEKPKGYQSPKEQAQTEPSDQGNTRAYQNQGQAKLRL